MQGGLIYSVYYIFKLDKIADMIQQKWDIIDIGKKIGPWERQIIPGGSKISSNESESAASQMES